MFEDLLIDFELLCDIGGDVFCIGSVDDGVYFGFENIFVCGVFEQSVEFGYWVYQLDVIGFFGQVFVDFQKWYNVVFFLQVLCCWNVVDFVIYCVFEQDCVYYFVVSKGW